MDIWVFYQCLIIMKHAIMKNLYMSFDTYVSVILLNISPEIKLLGDSI